MVYVNLNFYPYQFTCSTLSLLIIKAYKQVAAHREKILTVIILIVEITSVVLDQIGTESKCGREQKDKSCLLAAFLVSVFAFCVTLLKPSKTKLEVVEMVFSIVQLVVTFLHYIARVLELENDYDVSAFPVAFAMIMVVFSFIKVDQNNADDVVKSSLYKKVLEEQRVKEKATSISGGDVEKGLEGEIVKSPRKRLHGKRRLRETLLPVVKGAHKEVQKGAKNFTRFFK